MQKVSFKNCYFDSLMSFLFEHFSKAEVLKLEDVNLSKEEDKLLCEYGVIKNLLAGVREVNLSCKYPQNALHILDKYGMKGNAVVESMIDFPEVTDRVIVHIKDVLKFNDNELQDMAVKIGRTKVPLFITFGRTLKELGTIDKEYGQAPANFLESMGFLDRGATIIGGNALEKDDLMLLGSYDTKFILSPHADMYLGRGFVNLAPLISQGIEIGLASEIYPNVDMLCELDLAIGQTSNLMKNCRVVKQSALVDSIVCEPKKVKLSEEKTLQSQLGALETEVSNLTMLRYREIEKLLLKDLKEKLWK